MNSDTRPNTRRNQGPKTAGARAKSSSHTGRNGSFAGFRSKFPKKKPASSPPQTPRGEASPPPNYKDFDDAAWEKYFAMEEALGAAGQSDYAAEARQQERGFAAEERRPSPSKSWERQGRSQTGERSGGKPFEGSRSPSRGTGAAWQPRTAQRDGQRGRFAGSQGDSYRKATPSSFERRSPEGRSSDHGQGRGAPRSQAANSQAPNSWAGHRQASAGSRFGERDTGRGRATPPRSYGRDSAQGGGQTAPAWRKPRFEGQPSHTEQRGGRGKPAARSYERNSDAGASQRSFQRDHGRSQSRFAAAGGSSGRPSQAPYRQSGAQGHYADRGAVAPQERSSGRDAGRSTWGGHKKPSPSRFGERPEARGQASSGRGRDEQGQQGAPRSYGRHSGAAGQQQSRPAPRRPQHRTAPPGRYPSAEGQGRSAGGSFRERSFEDRPRPKKAAPGKAFHPASRQESRGAFDKPAGRSAKKSAKHARRDS